MANDKTARYREQGRAYRSANRARLRESKIAYRLAHLEADKAKKKAWYEQNRERILAKMVTKYTAERAAWLARVKARYVANRQLICYQQRQRYAANPELYKAKSRQRRAANLERDRARDKVYQKLYQEKDPARFLAKLRRANEKRRALKFQAFVEDVDKLIVFRRDNGICGICHRKIDPCSPWHLDHVVPLSQGGVHSYDNAQPAHARCNLSKQDTLPTGQIGLFQKLTK